MTDISQGTACWLCYILEYRPASSLWYRRLHHFVTAVNLVLNCMQIKDTF